MSLLSTQSLKKLPPLWDWPGWRGVAVAVAIMVVAIPVVLWYGQEEPAESAERAARLPIPPVPHIWRGPDGPQLMDPRFFPPIPIHSFELEPSEVEGPIMRIRFTQYGDELLVRAGTGKVMAICDTQGKKIFAESK